MQEIISWYMEHKTYGNILIIGIIGLMLYNIGYGVIGQPVIKKGFR